MKKDIDDLEDEKMSRDFKGLSDMVVVVSDDERELAGYRLGKIKSKDVSRDSVVMHVEACDVNVERNFGSFMVAKLTGQSGFKGREELDKDRKILVPKRFFIPLKFDGHPQVFLAFPERYESLPEGLKNHRLLGVLFELFYSANEQMTAELEGLKQKNVSDAEMYNVMTSGTGKFMDMINEKFAGFIKGFLDEQGIRKGGNVPMNPGMNQQEKPFTPQY